MMKIEKIAFSTVIWPFAEDDHEFCEVEDGGDISLDFLGPYTPDQVELIAAALLKAAEIARGKK